MTSWKAISDELLQARHSMPALLQVPITGMFVAGASLMLGLNDIPKLIHSYFHLGQKFTTRALGIGAELMLKHNVVPDRLNSYFNHLAQNKIQGRLLQPSTPDKLGDVAYAVSSTIGVLASSVSIAAFFYYSKMIQQALGYYLSSFAATQDFAQTRFNNYVLNRAAKKEEKGSV